jgi:DNA helicase-2/ATP-dependent DNA helicase PcrA
VNLDSSQQKFVDSDSDFVRLLAPAGAGKTQSLLQRCVRLATERPGDRFLIFAFTRAARNELVARLQNDPSLSNAAASIKVMTLNAWGNRMVRNTATKAKLVASQWDQKTVLDNALQPVWTEFPSIASALLDRRQVRAGRVILEAMEKLKSLGFRHDRADEVSIQKHVDWLTDLNLTPELDSMTRALEEFGIANSTEKFVKTMSEEFLPFWSAATETLFSQGFYTFEDQKYRPMLWLEGQIERGESWTGAARTAHLVVDEFQDINPLDLELIKKLAHVNSSSLTLVGDDDQAIFEWRGSSPDFILNPEAYFEREFQTFILETNYRSPRNVVELSQQLIKNNKRRVEKEIKANSIETAEVSVTKYRTVSDCVSETTSYVRSLLKDDSISSIALISRKRSQILPYQITFAAEDIPFYAAEDLNLGLSKAFEELQVLLAIRAQANQPTSPFGPSPWELVIKMADKVRIYPLSKADRTGLTQFFKAEKPASVPEAVTMLRTYTGPLKGSNTDAANSREFARSMNLLLEAPTVTAALQAISHGFMGLQKDWGKSEEDVYYTDPPFFYLAAMAEPYKDDFEKFYIDIKAALTKLAQVPEDDGVDDSYDEHQVKSKLHLMTALRAKGREFDVVIVLDSNDDIWPIRLAKTAAQLEQERRLFYVAMTRTKKRLRFVYSSQLFEARDDNAIESLIPGLEVDQLSEIDPLGLLNDRLTMNASRYLGEMDLLTSN